MSRRPASPLLGGGLGLERGARSLPAPSRRALVPSLLAAACIALTAGGAAAAPTPAPTAAAAEVRAETHTETFELVVQAQGPRLTLYLDRYADNAPVRDARIELDAGGSAVAVQPQPDGSYAALLPAGARRATLPLTVVVTVPATTGETSDLLALQLPADAPAPGAAAPPDAPADGMGAATAATATLRVLLIGGVLIAVTALALRALGRRRRTHRKDVA